MLCNFFLLDLSFVLLLLGQFQPSENIKGSDDVDISGADNFVSRCQPTFIFCIYNEDNNVIMTVNESASQKIGSEYFS